ncbi:MAG: TonB-dependent receptor [Bacteroidota bacterium]
MLSACLRLWVYFVLSLMLSAGLFAQVDSTATIDPDSLALLLQQNLNYVQVSAPRPATVGPVRNLFAQSQLVIGNLRSVQPQQSLQENLGLIAGLFSQNANNYAQDLRISIRGFGARSAFGIRGIKLIVDGIPETTPDGQGQIDNLPLGLINSLEVYRGPLASLYGNAAGGIISLSTGGAPDGQQLAFTLGSYGLQKYQFIHNSSGERSSFSGLLEHTRTDGYRQHSSAENTVLNLRYNHLSRNGLSLKLQANYTDSPTAQDPGGVNLESVTADREAARDRNLSFNAGEAIRHWKLGVSLSDQGIGKQLGWSSLAYLSGRQFSGRLPFEFGGWIELDRIYFGNRSDLRFSFDNWLGFDSKTTLSIGYDWAVQQDDRQRFRNLEGTQGAATLNQQEGFSNLGLFLVAQTQLRSWRILLSLRQDWNWISLDDRFNQATAERNLNALNPALGINWAASEQLNFFANYRTGFETPSLTELANNPNGEGGFNPDLGPQRSANIEFGTNWNLQRLGISATFFHIRVEDELIPFELAAFPERTFFRNAGSTLRSGLEVEAQIQLHDPLQLHLAYTYLSARYQDFELDGLQLADRQLPGIPQHWATARLEYLGTENLGIAANQLPITAAFQLRYLGELYADNSNEVEVPGYFLLDLNLGYSFQLGTKAKQRSLSVFSGINNLFNADYFDNIRINAFGSRFYEAAPGTNFYAGLRLKF